MGGVERPVWFGYEVAYTYEAQTGGNYNELLFKVAEDIDKAGQAIADNDIVRAGLSMRIKPLSDLVYFGMKYAHRKEGMEFNLDVEELAGMLFADNSAVSACITAIFDSLPKPTGEDAAKKKALATTTARPGSTGKALSKRRP